MQPTARPFRVSCRKVAIRTRPSLSLQPTLPYQRRYQNMFDDEKIRPAGRGHAPEGRRISSAIASLCRDSVLAWSNEPEQECCHLAHLDLLTALRDAVAAMVPINVLERLVP